MELLKGISTIPTRERINAHFSFVFLLYLCVATQCESELTYMISIGLKNILLQNVSLINGMYSEIRQSKSW